MKNRTKEEIWKAATTACAYMTWNATLLMLDKCKTLSCLFCGVAVAFTIAAAKCGNRN